ncbi:uncharacterized protein [Nicotiana tomentosiformis]|uniref:uncharacterized protein n=1 Tax=Nicotiana tomentosiformis TaxID=4098 RepID=UPI00388CD89A
MSECVEDVRGKGNERVAETVSPTSTGLNEETEVMMLWSEEVIEEEEKTPPTRVRTTRSQRKQTEADLEKALAESAKKDAKGKKKMGESSETIEIEVMDLVLHDEKKAKEVEVVTPSSKKPKTSKKKSPEKSVDIESSALTKRIRYVRKLRKVQIVEEESKDEETDEEKDKVVKFKKRTILKRRLLSDLEEEGMVNSEVKGVKVSFDDKEPGEIQGVPAEGYNDYTKLKWRSLKGLPTLLAITGKFADRDLEQEPRAVYKSKMKPAHKVLFEFLNKVVLPRQERRNIDTFMDLVLMECLDSGKKINWTGVSLKKWDVCTSKDYFGANTLTDCDYEILATPKEPGSSKRVPKNSRVRAFEQESGAKDVEIERLKKRLVEVETEGDSLRSQLARRKGRMRLSLEAFVLGTLCCIVQVRVNLKLSQQPVASYYKG